jgi:hypothetical protein
MYSQTPPNLHHSLKSEHRQAFKMSSPKCAICSADPSSGVLHKKCTQCKSISYCSKKCQAADWKYHKQMCKQFAEYTTNVPRPSATHRLVFLFPVGGEKPEVVWTPCTNCFGSGDADIVSLVGSSFEMSLLTGTLAVLSNNFRRRRLNHSLLIGYRIIFEYDGSQPNMSIESFMSGTQRYAWRGPIVVITNSATDGEDGDYTSTYFFLCPNLTALLQTPKSPR